MSFRTIIKVCISLVWLINGLYCKVLGYVPRHEQIVGRILGGEYAATITKAIGISEILMAVWVLSRVWSRLCTISQITLVAIMNVTEAILAPDLLLFGYRNLAVALLFIVVVWANEFYHPTSVLEKK